MLVDSNGQTFFSFVLADNVLIKEVFDFAWLGKRRPCSYRLSLLIVSDDLVADVDALIADIDRWPGNEFLHLVLRLSAE
jgi:hypothetical protein